MKQQGLFEGLDTDPFCDTDDARSVELCEPLESSPVLDPAEDSRAVRATIDAFMKAIEETFELNHRSWSTFEDCLTLFRCTLRRYTPGIEEEYMSTVARMQPDAARHAPKAFAILLDHFVQHGRFEDILGPVYQELGSKWKRAGLGQYFTPWGVCLLMAQMTFHDLEISAEKPVTLNEPAVGSGALLLAARAAVARQHGRDALRYLRVTGQDLDPVCCTMAEIQLLMTDDWFMQNWFVAGLCEIRRAKENSDGH